MSGYVVLWSIRPCCRIFTNELAAVREMSEHHIYFNQLINKSITSKIDCMQYSLMWSVIRPDGLGLLTYAVFNFNSKYQNFIRKFNAQKLAITFISVSCLS